MDDQDFLSVLAAVRAGDDEAFGRLWRSYQPGIVRYLTALVGRAAEDVASETWIAVMRALPRFSGDEQGFRRWLATIARHRAIDWGRERQRAPVLADAEQLALRMPAASDAGAVAIDRLTGRAAVELVVRALPPAEAEAVVLRFVLGLGIGDTADVMGKREGAVRVLTHRGLRRLNDHVERQLSAESSPGRER